MWGKGVPAWAREQSRGRNGPGRRTRAVRVTPSKAETRSQGPASWARTRRQSIPAYSPHTLSSQQLHEQQDLGPGEKWKSEPTGTTPALALVSANVPSSELGAAEPSRQTWFPHVGSPGAPEPWNPGRHALDIQGKADGRQQYPGPSLTALPPSAESRGYLESGPGAPKSPGLPAALAAQCPPLIHLAALDLD